LNRCRGGVINLHNKPAGSEINSQAMKSQTYNKPAGNKIAAINKIADGKIINLQQNLQTTFSNEKSRNDLPA
jgi:hypothetical protein